jgi:uncharacterized membrane protein YjjP (DUF1212 family)
MENRTKEIYKDNFCEYLLCLALDVGEGLLRSGGEVSRVEDTMERICRAYGAVHVEVFAIINFVTAAIRMPDGSYSYQLRRVRDTGTDLSAMEDLNALSRKICREKPALSEFEEMVKQTKHKKVYPNWVIILAGALVAGFFALFFGSTVIDGVIAAFAGALITVVSIYSPRRINGMAKTVVSAFIASLIAALSVKLGIGDDGGLIIIGTIMLLVPGVAFGTALRDLLLGDLLAGTLKTLQAVLCALMIAFGYMLAALIVGGGVI